MSLDDELASDLPYVYSTEGKIKEPNLLAEAGQSAMSAATSYLRGDVRNSKFQLQSSLQLPLQLGGVASNLFGFAKQAMNGGKANEVARQTKTSPADVISWSGCKGRA